MGTTCQHKLDWDCKHVLRTFAHATMVSRQSPLAPWRHFAPRMGRSTAPVATLGTTAANLLVWERKHVWPTFALAQMEWPPSPPGLVQRCAKTMALKIVPVAARVTSSLVLLTKDCKVVMQTLAIRMLCRTATNMTNLDASKKM